MSKLGKKDLFSPTVEIKPLLVAERPESLPSPQDVEKVMVMLNPRQVHELDRVCLEIRQSTGMKFKRSMLLRALIDGFLSAPLTFREAKSFEDITRKIRQSFQGQIQESRSGSA